MVHIDDPTFDLNLLGALHVLLEERNVTRASKRLGITQSSMSHTLARLRDALADPILVRSGRGMVPTPRAEALAAPLGRALAELRRVAKQEPAFDPATSTRTFTLACPDLVVAFLPDLVRSLARDAPGVRLDVVPSTGLDIPAVLGGGAIDAALAPAPEEGAGLAQRLLGRVTFCVLARRHHPALAKKRPWSLDAWLGSPHVVVRTGSASPGFVASALERAGRARVVGVTVPTFLAAPFIVAESDGFFTAPRELVIDIARRLDLAVLDVPLPVPRVAVALLWHERNHADPGHAWFRERAAEAAIELLKRDPSAGLRRRRSTGRRGR